MTSNKWPEDFEGGMEEMLNTEVPDSYEALRKLSDRQSTAVKLQGGGNEDSEAAIALKYGYSQPITQVSRLAQKLWGFMRDASVTEPVARSAVKGTNALANMLLAAPCLNRQGRWDEQEEKAKEWQRLIDAGRATRAARQPTDIDGDGEADDPDYLTQDILDRWGAADAFMLYARIYEEKHGIEAARHLYNEYDEAEKAKEVALRDAAKLPPNYNMLLACRMTQLEIMREQQYDLSMGNPTMDVTELKRKLANGADVHDIVTEMPWPFQESYQVVMSSMLDGEAHRTLLMALMAQQVPQQSAPSPWGAPYWPGMQPAQGDDDEEEPEDKRGALFNVAGWFSKKDNAQRQPQGPQRKRRRPQRGRNRGAA